MVTAQVARGKHSTLLQARDTDNSFVAVKLACTTTGAELVEWETRLLQSLTGRARLAPDVAGSGRTDGRPYCAMSWVRGAEVRVVAAKLRDQGSSLERLELCCRVARAYGALHARGVLHGRVHPRHVLVDIDGGVGLADFSLAASGADAPSATQLAAHFHSLSAPEHAESLLGGDDLSLSAAAEQYSVAALLYLLLTGRMYAPLRLKRHDLARAILANEPLPFAGHGLTPWPECEAVLGRALRKDPRQRYASMDAFAQSLAAASSGPADSARRPPGALAQPVQAALAGLLEAFRRDAYSDQLLGRLSAPTCSVNLGSAGVAFALTRLGKLTEDATAFERAELWLSCAERSRADADAFDDGDELTADTIGLVSPYHNASGLVAVRALLSQATGEEDRQQAALDEFRAATRAPCGNLDLTLGRSSVLLFAALLYAGARPDWPSAQRLAIYGDDLCAGIWRELPQATIAYHGIAHGWAGIAYATLMWAQARSVEPPPGTRDVLDMLSRVAEPYERGVRWPLTSSNRPGGDEYWPGWCHGNAGYVFLWNLARAVYRDAAFGELAECAAWMIDFAGGATSLCCGGAGQAYAALNHYRSTGDEQWRSCAIRIANRAASDGVLGEDSTSPLSLYKGHVGLALLAVELECAERAAMPLFEFESRAGGVASAARAS